LYELVNGNEQTAGAIRTPSGTHPASGSDQNFVVIGPKGTNGFSNFWTTESEGVSPYAAGFSSSYGFFN